MVAIAGIAGGLIRTDDGLIIPKIQDLTITRTPQTTELFTRPTCGVGLASTHAEIETQVTWQLDLTGPAFDGSILSQFLDQKFTASQSVTVPTLVCGTLDQGSTDVTVTGLGVDQEVKAAFEQTYDQDYLTQVTAAPAAVNEFQVTANTVVFNAQTTAKAYRITYESDQTLNNFLGGPGPLAAYGAREFFGAIQGLEPGDNPWIVWAPSATPTGARSLGTANDTIDSSYKLAVPTTLSWNFPLLFWQAPFPS